MQSEARALSPRVTYWTGTWDPAKEAISKEVCALRSGPRAAAPVVAFAPAQPTRWRRHDRVLTLSDGAWPVLRAAAALLEPRGDITHVFGGHFSWHLFRALGRRPILLTAVAAHDGGSQLPRDPARVVVEIDAGVEEWVNAGVPRHRITIVRPGVDLDWFAAAPSPAAARFTLLFASTPSDPSQLDARDLPLLVEVARQRPDCDVIVPWRQWGDVAAARRALEALAPPANFVVHHEEVRDMRRYYAGCHATVVSFAAGNGKACPNFVLEGFASGRPCLTTPGTGVARQVAASGAGVVADRDVAALSAAIDRLQAGWPGYAARARALAEEEFGLGRFLSQYERLYADILEESRETTRERVAGQASGSVRRLRGSLEESGKRKG